MKKASVLLGLGLAVILGTAAVPKANAGVVVGVNVGAPVYVHRGPVYVAPPYARGYVAPAYVAPYVGFRAYPPVYRRAYIAPPAYYGRWYGSRVVRRDYGWRR
jgi:hypothetical protein